MKARALKKIWLLAARKCAYWRNYRVVNRTVGALYGDVCTANQTYLLRVLFNMPMDRDEVAVRKRFRKAVKALPTGTHEEARRLLRAMETRAIDGYYAGSCLG